MYIYTHVHIRVSVCVCVCVCVCVYVYCLCTHINVYTFVGDVGFGFQSLGCLGLGVPRCRSSRRGAGCLILPSDLRWSCVLQCCEALRSSPTLGYSKGPGHTSTYRVCWNYFCYFKHPTKYQLIKLFRMFLSQIAAA